VGKKYMKELKKKFDMSFKETNHKIDMGVKKDYQVIIRGGGVCFRLGSGPQERIKFSVLVLSLGGTENGGVSF
jgi:hypothetical protein